ncbi:MAG: lipase family protein [Kofleriaceae bacterium]
MRAIAALLVLCACGQADRESPTDGAQKPDGHSIDAAMIDADLTAATDTPVGPCTDTAADVYAAQASTTKPNGSILACAPDAVIDQAALPALIGSDITVTSDVKMYRIAYQTRDHAGQPAVSTARAYLPSTPRARPVPIVVAMHGSVGLADSCVPSANQDNNLPLPYAARGFAVIAPDLAGLGNAGYQDYLDNHTQGWQTLDGARALRALLPTGLTADELILTGYSQGGGAVLSAHALIASDGPGIGTVKATVVFAPEWPISMKSFDYDAILRNPTNLTISEGLSYSSVAVLRQFAFLEDHVGAGHGVEAVPANVRSGLQSSIDSQCLVALGGYIQVSMLHTGDLIDPTLRSELLACEDGTAGCEGNGSAYQQFLAQNILAPDPQSGPVFIVAGLLDQIMPPAKEGSCIADRMHTFGVDVSACVISDATHTNIMDHHAKGLAWAESVLGGGVRYACDSSQLPACTN